MHNVCVFCGSSAGNRPDYSLAAKELGRLLAATGRTLVFGGGRVGLMGAVADAVLANGGRVVGVIPRGLAVKELAHDRCELQVVETMHERKARMAELADAFVALPGGFGTFEELLEITTWAQLGIHRKPCGLLNTAGYFDPLLTLFDHAAEEGFIDPKHRGIVVQATTPADLLSLLERYRVPEFHRWIDPSRS